MAGDPRKRHVGAGRERRVERVIRRDLDGDATERRDAVERELPGERTLERADRRRRGHDVGERTEHDHPGRLLVVAAGVCSHHRQIDPAGPRFPDPAVGIDREVVGDIPEAADVDVIVEDRLQNRRDLAGAVAVRAGAVVDERELDRAVHRDVTRTGVPMGPSRARDDLRLAGAGVEDRLGQRHRLSGACRGREGTHGDEVEAHASDRLRAAQLHVIGGAAPDRLAEQPGRLGGAPRVGGAARLEGAVRPVTEDRGDRPRSPGPAPGPPRT